MTGPDLAGPSMGTGSDSGSGWDEQLSGQEHEQVPDRKQKTPFYPQLLRLRHVHPNAWQRAVLGEGMAIVGGLLALADVASAWSILVLPAAVALVVKAHDVLAGLLGGSDEPSSSGVAPPPGQASGR